MCFGCSKEPSHREGSFEYPQHMFWLSNNKNNFQMHSLIWGPDFLTQLLKHILRVLKRTVSLSSSCKYVFSIRVENRVNPDQMASSETI